MKIIGNLTETDTDGSDELLKRVSALLLMLRGKQRYSFK